MTEPQAVCPCGGERVPLSSGIGSTGAKVFICQVCSHAFDFMTMARGADSHRSQRPLGDPPQKSYGTHRLAGLASGPQPQLGRSEPRRNALMSPDAGRSRLPGKG